MYNKYRIKAKCEKLGENHRLWKDAISKFKRKMEQKKRISLETITAKEIIGYVFSNMVIVKGEIKLKDKDQVEAGVEESLNEYAENWASENAKDWVIDHHP